MPSARYDQLKSRAKQLRLHLLPLEFSTTGDYSEEIRDRARGYRVLAHAEIEAYVEDRAREILIGALRDWKIKKEAREVLLSLVVHWTRGWEPGRQPPNKTHIDDLLSGINQAAKEYFVNLNSNHGIKEDNLKLLLSHIGLDSKLLDPAWLAAMNSFGESRGVVAHTSVTSTTEINPADELKDVEQLLQGLEILDGAFQALG